MNAGALTKYLQANDVKYKMAVISDRSNFILPQSYFACAHGHMPSLKLMSSAISGMVEPWSKVETLQWVKEYRPNENKVILANGKEFSYKALVLCPGK